MTEKVLSAIISQKAVWENSKKEEWYIWYHGRGFDGFVLVQTKIRKFVIVTRGVILIEYNRIKNV